jgi:hypothetical protein
MKQLVTDLFGRAKKTVARWNKSQPEEQQATSPVARMSAEEAVQVVTDLSRHIWLHAGNNRHDRRCLDAQLRKGAVQADGKNYPGYGQFHAKRKPLSKAARIFAKFQLKNSPPNQPAHIDRNGRLATNNPIYAAYAQQRGMQVVQ